MNLVFQLLMNLLLWSIPKHSVEIICLVFGKFHIEMQILYSWGKVTHLNSVLSTFSPRFLTIFTKKGTFVERFSTITWKFLSIVFCLVDNLSKTMFGNSKQSEFPALYILESQAEVPRVVEPINGLDLFMCFELCNLECTWDSQCSQRNWFAIFCAILLYLWKYFQILVWGLFEVGTGQISYIHRVDVRGTEEWRGVLSKILLIGGTMIMIGVA